VVRGIKKFYFGSGITSRCLSAGSKKEGFALANLSFIIYIYRNSQIAMPARPSLYLWKKMPFTRLVVPLIAGILIQFYNPFTGGFLVVAIVAIILLSLLCYVLPFANSYAYRWIAGVSIHLTVLVTGAVLIYKQDLRSQKNWFRNAVPASSGLLVTLQEPLVKKAKTYKAEASVDAVYTGTEWKSAEGRILVYFSNDSIKNLDYGSQVLFFKHLQPIRNSGNPGGFDYKQYSAFRNIFHQVFLKSNEYKVAATTNKAWLRSWLFTVRLGVIKILRQYIQPAREAGVAEALLIGFREDLDRDLVQAYSNTGVVHIIAISGLHLGMIYLALVWLLKPVTKKPGTRWIRPVVILVVLWLFTLLAGAVPSILRSAVMFSFIVAGEALHRKSSIYNTLASSAFVMLCMNPYFLWDVGFQLSYAAVISIVTFVKPIYNWCFLKNKLLDFFWKLTSVTIAAQVLTVPIIFYAFHQFPLVFLITNCIVVPLSSVVLFAELFLLTISFMEPLAQIAGIITSRMLLWMNKFIELVNSFPYGRYDGIENSMIETILLYLFIVAISYWLLKKAKEGLFVGLAAMLVFLAIDGYENYIVGKQQKMIVYNIPDHSAIDFIRGKQYAFSGDSVLLEDALLTKFHLKPSRTLQRISPTPNLADLYLTHPFILFAGKRIVVIDKNFKFEGGSRIPVDLIIVAHNPRLYIEQLNAVFDCKQFVFDGSNSAWRIKQWKKDCDSLHLRNYSTADSGAYEMNL
jgi:competence protein ComEC